MIYWVSYLLMKLLDLIYFRTTFSGKSNLPAKGGFIIASNHMSNLDPFILGICCWRRFGYLAKESLFKRRFANFFFRQVGAFPIKRDSVDVGAMKEAIKRLKVGCPLILFPEGTRGVGSRVKKANPGVAMIAVRAQVPVIPAYIEGTDKALPDGSRWFHRHHIRIKMGKPITYSKKQAYPEIAQDIVNQIFSLA